jgi:hypothetical protein
MNAAINAQLVFVGLTLFALCSSSVRLDALRALYAPSSLALPWANTSADLCESNWYGVSSDSSNTSGWVSHMLYQHMDNDRSHVVHVSRRIAHTTEVQCMHVADSTTRAGWTLQQLHLACAGQPALIYIASASTTTPSRAPVLSI